VVLFLVVGIDERAHDARVIRSLGMGLDEKALEAIGQWIRVRRCAPGKEGSARKGRRKQRLYGMRVGSSVGHSSDRR